MEQFNTKSRLSFQVKRSGGLMPKCMHYNVHEKSLFDALIGYNKHVKKNSLGVRRYMGL